MDFFSALTSGGASSTTAATGLGAAVGLGFDIAGTSAAYDANQAANTAQQAITGLQGQVQSQQNQAMNLVDQRAKMETLRNAQRARSMALSTATNQGAQYGSALPGAYGQISGQENTNLTSINQNQAIGNTIYGINQQIGYQQGALANAKTNAATAQGEMSLGNSIASSIGPLAKLFTL